MDSNRWEQHARVVESVVEVELYATQLRAEVEELRELAWRWCTDARALRELLTAAGGAQRYAANAPRALAVVGPARTYPLVPRLETSLTDEDRRAIRRTCELLLMAAGKCWRASIDVMPNGTVWIMTDAGQGCASLMEGFPSPEDALARLLSKVEP